MQAPPCSNGHPTELVGGLAVYPSRPDLASKQFWACLQCDEFVGCHPGTTEPLGTPANPTTRKARRATHAAFDPLWRDGLMVRSQAYAWLRRCLNMTSQQCHIGRFDIDTCAKVIALCDDKYQSLTEARDG